MKDVTESLLKTVFDVNFVFAEKTEDETLPPTQKMLFLKLRKQYLNLIFNLTMLKAQNIDKIERKVSKICEK